MLTVLGIEKLTDERPTRELPTMEARMVGRLFGLLLALGCLSSGVSSSFASTSALSARPSHTSVASGLLPLGMWGSDGLPLCPSTGAQSDVCVVPTIGGGCIVAWTDQRNGQVDVYAQRVDRSGACLWGAGGLPIAAGASTEMFPRMVADGTGGAYVSWTQRAGAADTIRVIRIHSSGMIVAGWPASGVPAFVQPGQGIQEYRLTGDSAGGLAFEIWIDWFALGNIYAQRLTSSGAWPAGWTQSGRELVRGSGHSEDYTQVRGLAMVGGANEMVFMGYTLNRTSYHHEYFEQHLTYLSLIGPGGWLANPVAFESWRSAYGLGRDGLGGAILAGRDAGSMMKWYRVRADGAVAWARHVGPAFDTSPSPAIVPGDDGRVFLAWITRESGVALLRAMLLDSTGVTDPGWPAEGELVRTPLDAVIQVVGIPDGAGGALLAWQDRFAGSSDIYAQWLTAEGGTPSGWSANGTAICVAPGIQSSLVGIRTDDGAIVLAWIDARATPSVVYAQRLEFAGPTATVTIDGQVRLAVDGRVELEWSTGASSLRDLLVERCNEAAAWSVVGVAQASGAGWRFADSEVRAGDRYGYRVQFDAGDGPQVGGEVWVQVPRSSPVGVTAVAPNPATDFLRAELSLGGNGVARVGIVDVSGRWRSSRSSAGSSSGLAVEEFSLAGLEPGLYWLVLDHAGGRSSRRFTILR